MNSLQNNTNTNKNPIPLDNDDDADLVGCPDTVVEIDPAGDGLNISSPGYPEGYANETRRIWHLTNKRKKELNIQIHDLDVSEDFTTSAYESYSFSDFTCTFF